jgi:copper transport protein
MASIVWMRYRHGAFVGICCLVIVCTYLLAACARSGTGTASPAQPVATPQQVSTSGKTSDSLYTVTLIVSPDQLGQNIFTVVLHDSSNAPVTNVRVSLETTMLDMNMGTDTLTLQPNGKGGFSGTGYLTMSGRWGIRVIIHAPDNSVHAASLTITTAS